MREPEAGRDLHDQRGDADALVGRLELEQLGRRALAQHARKDCNRQDQMAAGPHRRSQNVKEEDRSKVPASQTLSMLLTENDKIIWYMGVDNPETPPETNIADFSASGPKSVHKMLLEKNKVVLDLVKMVEDSVRAGLIPNKPEDIKQHKAAVKAAEKKGLIVLIKPDEKAKYRNLVDILDEMLVTNVARYAIVDLSDSEKELILNAK